jgi:hypothetical protein
MFLVTPDWSETWTAVQAEVELGNFKFIGPGFYHCKGDTILAIPLDRPREETWSQKFEPDERFEFNVWNGPGPDLNLLASAPTRQDDR